MENYKLLGTRDRISKKTNKEYTIAYVLHENNYGYDILPVMLKEQQINAVKGVINDDSFDLNQFVGLEYNSFNKRYDLKINFGL